MDTNEEHVEIAKRRVLGDNHDRDVWVVERNPGSGWRVSAVLTTHEEAEMYRDDLRTVLNTYPEDLSDEFKNDHTFRIRHGARRSPTKMFETYPPEENDAEE